ncbi:cell envelope integrity protein CreD [Alteraurantiacibacter aestuarii]|uniref:Cell envelope integrity protein CreD n=1 Tax=Alteraurantiacibacter aestuarii TaxID=650004 RepID=A0A844ZKS8_9SPHN|nr:cell envelope integrity protein CreD [Alteraurantiacibacter aestuarii]MXO87620.1 cell envelope integrity protein CreD [Alteraurantiacibacter aestuarii]
MDPEHRPEHRPERSPGAKLALTGLVALVLMIPLMMVYSLVYDRESQSQTAQASIAAGWGGAQTVTGPVLVVPWMQEVTRTQTIDGEDRTTTTSHRRELFFSPAHQSIATQIDPDRKGYAIYETVVYDSAMSGTARFEMPDDLERYGVKPGDLLLDQVELLFGVSDPRGLKDDVRVSVNGEAQQLQPGNGPAATNGSGFSAFTTWDASAPLNVAWEFGIRGSKSLSVIPRGGETEWTVTSSWPHPSFGGSFLPDSREITDAGFTANYDGITNLALGRALVAHQDDGPPVASGWEAPIDVADERGEGGTSLAATIGLTDPVDLYSQVDRAVKYGFLFIGFTFATFLMFDIVGGARVAAAEYLLTGAGLVLFFVLLLAFAEVTGFGWAYVIAAGAVIGLLTAYSAAVLGTWRRAGFVGAMLAGLYAVLFVLLNMETYSLLIGALLLFVALAGIMYATRGVNWSAVGRSDNEVAAA